MKKHTILIVDDENFTIDSFEVLLSDNFNLLVARSGEKALELIRQVPVDLVFLDSTFLQSFFLAVLFVFWISRSAGISIASAQPATMTSPEDPAHLLKQDRFVLIGEALSNVVHKLQSARRLSDAAKQLPILFLSHPVRTVSPLMFAA